MLVSDTASEKIGEQMTTLHIYRGMPGSGKSTAALDLLKDNPDMVRVNRDSIRMSVFGKKVGTSFSQENRVSRLSKEIARDALRLGNSVVVDDTNLRPRYVKEWYALAQEFPSVEVSVREWNLELDDLLIRNATRPEEDWIDPRAITGMFERYTKKGKLLPVDYTQWLEEQTSKNDRHMVPAPQYKSGQFRTVVVDIDGTLATNDGSRGWFEWDKVGEDSVVEEIRDLVNAVETWETAIVCLSGRDEVCRKQTEEWLKANGINYDSLFMRPEGNTEEDSIIKYRLFDEHLRSQNVWFVVDDRPSVCRMWRSIGLKVLQVGDPHEEF